MKTNNLIINPIKSAQKQAQTFVQPTTFTLNLKEMAPKFPIIPANLGGGEVNNTSLLTTSQNNSFNLTASSAATPTTSSHAIKTIQRKKEMIGLGRSSSQSAAPRHGHQIIEPPNNNNNNNNNLKPDLQIQYKYLLNRLSREKSMQHQHNHHQVVADRIEPLSINHRSNAGFTLTKFSK